MSASFQQILTVRPGGVLEVRSAELHEGDQAQVTVVVLPSPDAERSAVGAGGWRRFAGAVNSKDPRAGDNQRIDADLAAEFGGSSNPES
jgi:hypothetical protein